MSLMVLAPSKDHKFHKSQYSTNEFDNLPTEKRFNDFYGEEGGLRSSIADNSPGEEIYFLGIIDILTPYDSKKKIEHLFKSLHYEKVTGCFFAIYIL